MDKNKYGIFFSSFFDNVSMNNIPFIRNYLAIVPPQKEYYKLTKGISFQFSISIKTELFQELFAIKDIHILELDKKYFEDFHNLILLILNMDIDFKEDVEYYEFRIISYLKLFLKRKNYIKDTVTYLKKFNDIMDYIKQYNLYDISISELSLKFKVSERTLRNIFYSSVGYSPKKYLKIIQLNNLRKSLSNDKLSIAQIIINENLPPQSQISREFKNLFLKTPLHYKKALDTLA